MMKSGIENYEYLLLQLNEMLTNKERGYNTALELNDRLWEEVEMHKDRIEEQINHVKGQPKETWEQQLSSSESIYEAARTFISKYGTKETMK